MTIAHVVQQFPRDTCLLELFFGESVSSEKLSSALDYRTKSG